MEKVIDLGCMGWNRPNWSGTFYPEDLPEDWQLTYFNTQFACVALDEALWREADAATLANWANDTHDRFTFLLLGGRLEEVPAALAGRARMLSADDPALIWFDRATPIRRLSDQIRAADGRHFVVSRDGDLARIGEVRTLLELLGL